MFQVRDVPGQGSHVVVGLETAAGTGDEGAVNATEGVGHNGTASDWCRSSGRLVSGHFGMLSGRRIVQTRRRDTWCSRRDLVVDPTSYTI